MGLDAVTILMETEEHFGISIQTTEAEQVRTVGDLVAVIHERIIAAHQPRCVTLPAFLALRRLVREVTEDASQSVRPRSRVTAILDRRQRRRLWQRLSELLGSPPRELRRPSWLRGILLVSAIALLLMALGVAFAVDIQILPATIAVAAISIVVLHFVTVPSRLEPPTGWKTFGDITNKIAGRTVATKMLHLQTRDDVLAELRPLLVDVLGIDATEVTATARFVEDLGMD